MPTQSIHEMSDEDLEIAVNVAIFGVPEARARFARPPYTSDVAAAWAVAEKLREAGWLVTVKAMPDGEPFLLDDDDPRARLYKRHTCSLTWMRRDTPEGTRRYIFSHPWGFGETLGQAICRATLEAMHDGWVPA